MSEQHLDALAIAAGLLERFRFGQRSSHVSSVFVDVSHDPAGGHVRAAFWLEPAFRRTGSQGCKAACVGKPDRGPLWVKGGKAQHEQIKSGLPQLADESTASAPRVIDASRPFYEFTSLVRLLSARR